MKLPWSCLALAALAVSITPAVAQLRLAGASMSRQEMLALKRNCGADYHRFCKDVEQGGGRAIACLVAHRPQLSTICQTTLQTLHHQAG
jgi:hypothetical protein